MGDGWCALGQRKAQALCDGAHRNAASAPELLCTGQAFGFERRGGPVPPMFPFDANDLVLKVGMQGVRAELQSPWSGWTLASWIAGPHARGDGRGPADVLDAELDAVVRAARSRSSVEEGSLARVRRGHEVAAPS